MSSVVPNLYRGSLGEFLYTAAKSHPQNKIIQVNGVTGDSQTIGEVLRDAESVAAGLQARGVLPGDVIILIGNYTPRYYATTLGIMFANAVLFPINPGFKEVELEHLINVVNPKMVFAESHASFRVTAALHNLGNRAEVVLLDDIPESDERAQKYEEILSDRAEFKMATVADPANDIALIMHSSGTTGLPKALQITHTAIIYSCQLWEDKPEIKKQSVVLQATLGSWLIGFLITLQSFAYGFKRIYTNPATTENLLKAIHNGKPEWVVMMPFGLLNLVTHPDFHKFDVSSLRWIMIGGTPPMKGLEQTVHDKWPKIGLTLEQTYGSSEMSYYSEPFSSIPFKYAGKVIRGLEYKIVDVETQRTLARNEYGELRFRSKYPLLREYLGNPEATAAAMDEDGFFKTEDIGTVTEEGYIHLTGRLKDYIQTMFGRVTPWLLESWIQKLEGVEDVVVVGKPQPQGVSLVAAAVVKAPNSTITEQQITQHVQDNYSAMYNLNGGVRFIDLIPRNANGKVLREKVREML